MWWMAIAAAAANQISYGMNVKKNRDEIKRQQGKAEDAYRYQQQYQDNMWDLQRGEALETLGIQRNRLAESFGADVAGFNLGLEGQALGNHAARVSLSDSAGMALAAQGASGTRGSGSLQKRIDFQENMFGRQTGLRDRGNSLAMGNMTRQYSNSFADIGREVDSWRRGGYKYRAKELSDVYARQMHGLQMDEYEHAYDAAGFNILDFMVSGLGGAAQGAAFGAQIDSYREQLQQPGQGQQPAAAQPTQPPPPSYDFEKYMPDYLNGKGLGINNDFFWRNFNTGSLGP